MLEEAKVRGREEEREGGRKEKVRIDASLDLFH